jgi:hypothetical protein
VIFAALVLAVAGCVFLVFLAVPRLRRHALKAVAAVFGFAAGSVGSMFFFALAYGLFREGTLPAWAVGVPGAILGNIAFYGGGIIGAWLAVWAAGWAQSRLLGEGLRRNDGTKTSE